MWLASVMSGLVPLRRADRFRRYLLTKEDRKRSAHHQGDAIDPDRSSVGSLLRHDRRSGRKDPHLVR